MLKKADIALREGRFEARYQYIGNDFMERPLEFSVLAGLDGRW
jgi:hypothetical protein